MFNKAHAMIVLSAFTLLSTACITWSRTDVKTMAKPLREGTPVLSVVMNSGQVIEFTKADPGLVKGSSVVGAGHDSAMREMEVAGPFSTIRKDGSGKIFEVVDAKGQGYVVKTVIKRDEVRMTILGSESRQYAIPLAEISTVEFKKDHGFKAAMIVICVFFVLALALSGVHLGP